MTDMPTPTNMRTSGWEERLTDFLVQSEVNGVCCDWTTTHCAKWSNEAVILQNERNVYSLFDQGNEITDPAEAYKAIRKAGYEDFNAVIAAHFKEKPIAFANRGDLVFIRADGPDFEGLGMSFALGIADPPFWYALGKDRLGRGLLREAAAVFDIEEAP
jgi:hypothetical protein